MENGENGENDDDDARFRPPPVADSAITLDAPLLRHQTATTTPPTAGEEPGPPPLCEEHNLEQPCAHCVVARQMRAPKPPGALAKRYPILREKTALRMALGLVLSLACGFVLTSPYATRQERRVAVLKKEADVDRYRYAADAQARARALDAKAESLANSAAITTIAAWLLLGGLAYWGWYHLT